jgi:hypothetical protein
MYLNYLSSSHYLLSQYMVCARRVCGLLDSASALIGPWEREVWFGSMALIG